MVDSISVGHSRLPMWNRRNDMRLTQCWSSTAVANTLNRKDSFGKVVS
jgi:hypothetical protein